MCHLILYERWPIPLTCKDDWNQFLQKNDYQLKNLVIVKQILFVNWGKCIANKKKNMHTDVKVLSINWGSFDLLRTVKVNLHVVKFNSQFFFFKDISAVWVTVSLNVNYVYRTKSIILLQKRSLVQKLR